MNEDSDEATAEQSNILVNGNKLSSIENDLKVVWHNKTPAFFLLFDS
jgi:hypothetical protein